MADHVANVTVGAASRPPRILWMLISHPSVAVSSSILASPEMQVSVSFLARLQPLLGKGSYVLVSCATPLLPPLFGELLTGDNFTAPRHVVMGFVCYATRVLVSWNPSWTFGRVCCCNLVLSRGLLCKFSASII
ncbi:hypothetical protein PVAP13_8KG298900 [Panicum virgatum]|uniref:Uncharacterized protein n=1 Tax=Panicum virgatum TaxID=38727 RepID=A0A8T0PRD4_PANVG|nr:hypothetical protein PVAP13_8KG298900 [Panicum virgatum]